MRVSGYYYVFFFFKQKTAYELRISDWSSDVCSSDLVSLRLGFAERAGTAHQTMSLAPRLDLRQTQSLVMTPQLQQAIRLLALSNLEIERSEEHTSELQSLMRISYAVFCLKKKTTQTNRQITTQK